MTEIEFEVLCDVQEVADVYSCSISTVWRRVSAGAIPRPIKIGGTTRWIARELSADIANAISQRDKVSLCSFEEGH